MKSEWLYDPEYDIWEIHGADCLISLEPRPPYCDRGRLIAKIHITPRTGLSRNFDRQDGWPRYYFDESRAKLEIEAWLHFRKQWIEKERKVG